MFPIISGQGFIYAEPKEDKIVNLEDNLKNYQKNELEQIKKDLNNKDLHIRGKAYIRLKLLAKKYEDARRVMITKAKEKIAYYSKHNFKSDGEGESLSELIEDIADFNDSSLVPLFIDSLNTPTSMGLKFLKNYPNESIPLILEKFNDHSDKATLSSALVVISKSTETNSNNLSVTRKKFIELTKDKYLIVRELAIEGLGNIGTSEDIHILMNIANNDPSKYDRELAKKAIDNIKK